MIPKRLRDYDRSPVFSGRFQNLAGEHGKVGFKYTADDFGCDGCIPANQPVAKGNDPLLNCRSIQQAMGCSGLPGSDGASPTISNWRFAPLASQEFLEFARYEAAGKRQDRMMGQPRITRHCIACSSGIEGDAEPGVTTRGPGSSRRAGVFWNLSGSGWTASAGIN